MMTVAWAISWIFAALGVISSVAAVRAYWPGIIRRTSPLLQGAAAMTQRFTLVGCLVVVAIGVGAFEFHKMQAQVAADHEIILKLQEQSDAPARMMHL
ncbi:hypothetical protein LA345_13240 [Burkholderia vietnamiensis]|uniref:Uncharacterized protein n=1 Tax=Burkholderia vietnamiensis (strain G4 / LMG 22486) TaxID=269482 RepID=A4JFR7_BURVG|nr:hypothetical protein Bcep1808_2118 [Burkholderia vietnamiensis G4]MCB4344878.1 hypothetical protein [Burkholderia vietnamiensis]